MRSYVVFILSAASSQSSPYPPACEKNSRGIGPPQQKGFPCSSKIHGNLLFPFILSAKMNG